MGVGIGGSNYGTWGVGPPYGAVAGGSTGIGYGGYGSTGVPNSYLWNPNAYAPGTDMGSSLLGQTMSEQDPRTAYYRYGQQLGVPDDNSAFGRWFGQQYGNVLQGYNAATVSDPFGANIQGYLSSLGGYQDWMNRFSQLSPQQRGLNPANGGGGPARWISR